MLCLALNELVWCKYVACIIKIKAHFSPPSCFPSPGGRVWCWWSCMRDTSLLWSEPIRPAVCDTVSFVKWCIFQRMHRYCFTDWIENEYFYYVTHLYRYLVLNKAISEMLLQYKRTLNKVVIYNWYWCRDIGKYFMSMRRVRSPGIATDIWYWYRRIPDIFVHFVFCGNARPPIGFRLFSLGVDQPPHGV